jgi:nickel-type superoxide dismutase maturation protease
VVHGGIVDSPLREDGGVVSSPFRENRLKSLALWLLGRRKLIHISGDSMSPVLNDGDAAFVDPGAYRRSQPQVDDLVLSAHPYRTDTQLVKSVREVREDGAVFLIGRNRSASTDSRSFGPVPGRLIRGRVVSRRQAPL